MATSQLNQLPYIQQQPTVYIASFCNAYPDTSQSSLPWVENQIRSPPSRYFAPQDTSTFRFTPSPQIAPHYPPVDMYTSTYNLPRARQQPLGTSRQEELEQELLDCASPEWLLTYLCPIEHSHFQWMLNQSSNFHASPSPITSFSPLIPSIQLTRVYHPGSPTSASTSTSGVAPARGYQCSACSKHIKRKADLERHRRVSCPKLRGKATILCPTPGCTANFSRKDDLQKHLKKRRCRPGSKLPNG